MDPAQCRFCGEEFSKKGIARHIVSCAPKHVDSQNGTLKSWFQLAIRSDDTPEYWLYLLVDPSSTLQQLDRFFRDTWLECCDHASYFQIGERQYFSDEAPGPERCSMAVRLMDLPDEQVPMRYVYDFDSPTVLNISSVSPVEYADSAAGFIIAARNQPPPYTCGCGNHASILNRDAIEDTGSQAFYCSHCITKYEGNLNTLAPLTNSPRMGICGYYGPSGDQTGEYQSFRRAEDVIRDFRRNHDSTRLSDGDATEREQIIRRYMRLLHVQSIDENQLRHVRFISRNITCFASALQKLLDERFRRWRTKGERPRDPAHIYALYLLTDVADDTLFADIADSFSDYKSMRAVWGNAFQEPGARRRLFATVSREAPEPLIFFALQEDIDTFIQQSAIDALVTLYLDDFLPREMLVDLLHQLAERAIAEQNEQVADMTVSTCMVIYPEDVIRIVQRLVHSGLLDESRPDYLEAVRETLKRYRREEHLERVRSIGFYGFVEEPLEELREALRQFASEPETRPESPEHAEAAITGEGNGRSQSVNGTIYRTDRKVGRNEPCPCGSGKKYKRCCGR